ncbi:hypothetical protein AA0312_1336 [Acetobacter tropicalis NRIC 0312]|uniref:Uncharacterized protein n=1 Tax=Acetobacter tropicalis TaxID=104102 RepID=A0A511FKA5_9PROT|nr:hypothetical protein ATR1_042d0075 [Acetobacter tropicalis]GBR69314.1 hypothetical protein AA0312_1336 [Acetobacter tropicalis NRIC 0312]GEL49665.1 hypothetical protein ATR01nite_07400 [Acetobacter tropicalis]
MHGFRLCCLSGGYWREPAPEEGENQTLDGQEKETPFALAEGRQKQRQRDAEAFSSFHFEKTASWV